MQAEDSHQLLKEGFLRGLVNSVPFKRPELYLHDNTFRGLTADYENDFHTEQVRYSCKAWTARTLLHCVTAMCNYRS